jgi:hypothetical protein
LLPSTQQPQIKRLLEGLCFLIGRDKPHQNADPPHAVSLLPARHHRPCSCAASQRDEFASSHTRLRTPRGIVPA